MSTTPHSPEGFLLFNKPSGISSYGCIAQIKRAIGRAHKIGHAGTLDPFADGLLIVGIGRPYTKQLSHIMAYPKEYIAQGELNLLTDTLDPTGKVVCTETKEVSREQLEAAIKKMGMAYEQIPPIYSALKFKGQCLYKAARTGRLSTEELERITIQKKRTVQLYQLELVAFDPPYFTIKARVSCGTYIRSLVNDIAGQCDTHATTKMLTRTEIGPFTLDNAAEYTDIAAYWTEKGSWLGTPFFRKEL